MLLAYYIRLNWRFLLSMLPLPVENLYKFDIFCKWYVYVM